MKIISRAAFVGINVMFKIEKFISDLRDGSYGEHVVWNLLIKQPNVKSIVDVRDDKNFQKKDIDFLVEDINRQFTPVEVKTDFKTQDTGNIVYELSCNGGMGCFEKSDAKVFMYYVPATKTVYEIDAVALRTYLQKVRPEEVPIGDNATGFILSIDKLRWEGSIIKNIYSNVI